MACVWVSVCAVLGYAIPNRLGFRPGAYQIQFLALGSCGWVEQANDRETAVYTPLPSRCQGGAKSAERVRGGGVTVLFSWWLKYFCRLWFFIYFKFTVKFAKLFMCWQLPGFSLSSKESEKSLKISLNTNERGLDFVLWNYFLLLFGFDVSDILSIYRFGLVWKEIKS